jgi:hypothetical protein
VEDGDQLQTISPDAVRDDVWGIRHDKLSCSEHPTGPADLGMSLERIDWTENPRGYQRRILPGVLRDEIS